MVSTIQQSLLHELPVSIEDCVLILVHVKAISNNKQTNIGMINVFSAHLIESLYFTNIFDSVFHDHLEQKIISIQISKNVEIDIFSLSFQILSEMRGEIILISL